MVLALVGRNLELQTWQTYGICVDNKIGWVVYEYSEVKVPSQNKKELVQFINRSNFPLDI